MFCGIMFWFNAHTLHTRSRSHTKSPLASNAQPPCYFFRVSVCSQLLCTLCSSPGRIARCCTLCVSAGFLESSDIYSLAHNACPCVCVCACDIATGVRVVPKTNRNRSISAMRECVHRSGMWPLKCDRGILMGVRPMADRQNPLLRMRIFMVSCRPTRLNLFAKMYIRLCHIVMPEITAQTACGAQVCLCVCVCCSFG